MDNNSRAEKSSASNDKLTIVIPVYNEAGIISSVVDEIDRWILKKLPGSEIFIINDGSTDSTLQILNQNCLPRIPALKVFSKSNEGHGKSVLYGMSLVADGFILLMDSDNQTDPQDFWKLWEKRGKETVVAGIRKVRSDPPSRIMLSMVLRKLIQALFGIKCRDSNVPFKLFHHHFYREFKRFLNDTWLIPSIGISILAGTNSHWRLIEIPITHRPRKTGVCSLQHGKLLKFSIRSLVQLIVLKNKIRLC